MNCRSLLIIGIAVLLTACHSDTDRKDAAQCAKHYKAESYKVALRKCENAAQQGDLNSQWILANIYTYGLADDKDYEQAVVWLTQAAENGHTAAQRELGKRFMWGKGAERNIDNALKWFKLAAREGDTEAEFFIGVIYLGNKEHKGDQASAMNWFKKAAAAGHKMAINNLAWLYATSTNKSLRNGKQGILIMRPLVEKEPNSSVFLDTLAAAYAEVEDFPKAIEVQQQAIDNLPTKLQPSVRQGYLDRLEVYKDGKPWREQAPDWGDEKDNRADNAEEYAEDVEQSSQSS